jgi:hypothetical protein
MIRKARAVWRGSGRRLLHCQTTRVQNHLAACSAKFQRYSLMAVDSSLTGGIGLTLCRLAISIQRGGGFVLEKL